MSRSLKHRTPMEEYFLSLEIKPEVVAKQRQFDDQLRQFYKQRWNCILKPPVIDGEPVNLYKLYTAVQNYGGWIKVSNCDRWRLVAEEVGYSPDDVFMMSNGIKLIYMRYLSKYEEVVTVGELDDHDGKLQSKGFSTVASNECPISSAYRSQRHEVVEAEYAKLAKSLYSGLPNEVDFAFNVLTIMSAPGPHVLRVEKCPHLVTLIIAHAGVYGDDRDIQDIAEHGWRLFCDRQFDRFWSNAGIDDSEIRSMIPTKSSQYLDSFEQQLFSTQYDFDLSVPTCFRIHQTTSILRNLSFELFNTYAMGKSDILIQYMCVCAASKHTRLVNDALDIISNIASEIDLMTSDGIYVHCALLKIVADCLDSQDKNRVLHALEIIAALCQNERNESVITEFMESYTLDRIFQLATVRDILICIHTLETLYQFSELGRASCSRIVSQPNAIEQLVNLITTDALSFGRTGLSGIQVVESLAHQQARQAYAAQAQAAYRPPGYMMPPGQGYAHPGVPATPRPGLSMQQRMPPPPTPQALAITQDERLKALTVKWIKDNCVSDPNSMAVRGEMYSAYVEHLRSVNGIMSGSVQMFTGIIQSLFPNCTIQTDQREQSVLYLIGGVRYLKQSATTINGQLPAPRTATPTVADSQIAASHPVMKKILSTPKGVQPPAVQPPTTNGIMKPVDTVPKVEPGPSRTTTPLSTKSAASSVAPTENGSEIEASAGSQPPKLEVCSAAIEARSLLPEGDQHETQIIRVENTNSTKGSDDEKPEEEEEEEPIKKVNGSTSTEEMENAKPADKLPNGDCNGAIHINGDEENCVNAEESNKVNGDVSSDSLETSGEQDEPNENGATSADIDHNSEDELPPGDPSKIDDTIEAVCKSTEPVTKNGLWKSTRPRRPSKKVAEDSTTVNGSYKRKAPTPKFPAKKARKGRRSGEQDSMEVDQPTESSSVDVPIDNDGASTSSCNLMCEWNACGRTFATVDQIMVHHRREHVIDANRLPDGTFYCYWPTCDGTKRGEWSLITHIQDHHCQERILLDAMEKRNAAGGPQLYLTQIRKQLAERPKESIAPQNFPTAAAEDAIRRHAFQHPPMREVIDENEGPVTKCIRLTTALILRNIARYSEEGRSHIRRYEMQICPFALSRLEAGSALAQCLSELYPLKGEDGEVEEVEHIPLFSRYVPVKHYSQSDLSSVSTPKF